MPNPYQPRIRFDETKLKELSETIRQHGIIQPIVVRRVAGRYEIVSGERRWQAAKLANLSAVNVIIRNFDDKTMLEAALIENIEREDLSPIEIAKAIRQLMERFSLTQDDVAEKLSKDRSTISNLTRLLSLPDPVQEMLAERKIEFGHAKAILSVPSHTLQIDLALKISREGWSVRKAEDEARRMASEITGTHVQKKNSLEDFSVLEQEFARHFGTVVQLRLKKRGDQYTGRMEIKINAKDDVDRILDIVRKGDIETRHSTGF